MIASERDTIQRQDWQAHFIWVTTVDISIAPIAIDVWVKDLK